MLLARTVTHATVAETKRRMTRLEFLKWGALYRMEPWGDEWSQIRALAAATLAPWNKRRIHLEQYFPNTTRRQTPEQLERMLTGFAERHNQRIERNAQQCPSSATSQSRSRPTRSASRRG